MALPASVQKMMGRPPREGSCLGLYLSRELFCLSEVRLAKYGSMDVMQMVKVPVPVSPKETTGGRMGTLNTDFLSETKRLAGLIQPVLQQGEWKSKKVVVTLSSHFGISRYFVMPQVHRRFWKQSVPLEAKKYIPFPLTSMHYDFQILPIMAQQGQPPRMGVFFAAVPEKNIEHARALVEVLGLEQVAVELSTYSASRVWSKLPSPKGSAKDIAQVHFEPHSAYILLHSGGVPYITREVHWTGEYMESRRINLGGSMEFAKKQFGISDFHAVVTGSIDLEAWRGSLEEDTGQPVEWIDLKQALGLPSAEWGLVASAGAAVRRVFRGLMVDVSGAYRKVESDQRVVRAVALLGGGLGGLLLCLALFHQARVVAASQTLGRLQKTTSSIGAFRGLPGDRIEGVVQNLQAQTQTFGKALGNRIYATRILNSLVTAIPESAWLKSAMLANEVGRRGSKVSLRLTGYALGLDRNSDVLLANQFWDALKKDKDFEKMFPQCDLSFETDEVALRSYERTAFLLTCERGE